MTAEDLKSGAVLKGEEAVTGFPVPGALHLRSTFSLLNPPELPRFGVWYFPLRVCRTGKPVSPKGIELTAHKKGAQIELTAQLDLTDIYKEGIYLIRKQHISTRDPNTNRTEDPKLSN